MIVKNESRVISRLLESVHSYVDYYCICDTGSTDDTISLIRTFFESKGIHGVIYEEPFRDFGYNRTFALEKCREDSVVCDADFILLLDADMKLDVRVSPEEFRACLTESGSYCVFQGSPTFFYKNVRILPNRAGYSYWGVTHEYITEPDGSVQNTLPAEVVFINDIGDGGSKQNKYERDIELLLKGLENLPNNDRYTFYLANSYRGAGQHEKAIEYYRKRIAMGGWREEVWNSYLAAGNSYKDIGQMEQAIIMWLEGYDYWDERIENLFEIIKHYRIVGKQRLAYMLYTVAEKIANAKTTWDNLFLHKDVYDYLLDYEMTILGYYHNDANYDLRRLTMRVISDSACPNHIIKNAIMNYKFYSESILKWQTYVNANLATPGILADIGKSFHLESQGFVSSTPSIILYDNTLVANVRYVNYSIDAQGNYVNGEHITTINVIATFDISSPKWVKQSEFVLNYDTTRDGRYVGLEDVKLACLRRGVEVGGSGEWTILYNANRGIGDVMAVEHGILHLERKCVEGNLVKIPYQGNLEKNWVILPKFGNDGEIIMVYGWYPLKIGGVGPDGILNITHTHNTPAFFRGIRGSTNGIIVDGEIWMICHFVNYEDRRYYYHMIVVLDIDTYELKRHTRLFTFEGGKVEYTTGFVYLKRTCEFLIGYSVMDHQTKYMVVDKPKIDAYMVEGR
jgi:tetratricopeptide (TPR) repeat protein